MLEFLLLKKSDSRHYRTEKELEIYAKTRKLNARGN